MAASQRRSADARSAALDAGLKTAPGLTLGLDAGKKALELAEGSDLGGKASKFGTGFVSKAKGAASGAVDAAKGADVEAMKGGLSGMASAAKGGAQKAAGAVTEAAQRAQEAPTTQLAEHAAATKVQAIARGNAARAASDALGDGKAAVLEKARSTAKGIGEYEAEPTVDRRNVLLTRNGGEVEGALRMVAHKGLLTDTLPGLAASSIPFVGIAYNMIHPVWEQMRAVCLIAALYGHDIEKDEEVQEQILICVMGDRAEAKAKGKKGVAGKVAGKAADKLAQHVASKFAAKQASAMAICSGPVAPILNAMVSEGMSKEAAMSTAAAEETFRENAREVPKEEYWVDLGSSSLLRHVEAVDAKLSSGASAIDDRLGLSEKAASAAAAAKGAVGSAARSVDEKFAVHDRAANARQAGQRKATALASRAQSGTTSKFRSQIDTIGDSMVESINNSLGLPRYLRNIVDSLVRDILVEIENSGVNHIEGILSHHEDDGPEDPARLKEINCLQRLRGFVLYHWMPYDHSSFYKLSDPVWLVLKLGPICLAPYGGVFLFHLLLFLMIDKSDNFQLVKFIVQFKGLQAISLGLVSLFIGGQAYIRCANRHPRQTCDVEGPGAGENFLFKLAGWLGCLALVWLSVLLLKCRRGQDPHAGGKLVSWLLYDLLCFAFCAYLVADAVSSTGSGLAPGEVDPKVSEMMFWAKALYGVLSLPFIVFMMPLVDVLFTHAHVTAYTPSGVCRKKLVVGPESKLRQEAADNLESSEVLSSILTEMLKIAVRGGALPFQQWSAQMAPTFQHYAEAWTDRVDRVKTAAEGKGGGMKAIASGTFSVATDDARAKSKVALASAANTMARQLVFSLNATLELPKFLSKAVEGIVLGFVPDITETLAAGTVNALEKRTGIDLDGDGTTGIKGKAGLTIDEKATSDCTPRGWLLSSWMPYNQLGGGPFGWLLNFLAGCPLLGTNYVMCVLMFVLIEKTEYQLTRFALSFKGMQAISTGLVFTFIGVVTYMGCLEHPELGSGSGIDDGASSSCYDSQLATFPAALFYTFITFWLLSVGCVWVAFVMLLRIHSATLKTATAEALANGGAIDEAEAMTIAADAGHLSRTRNALLYDMLCAVICGSVVGYYLPLVYVGDCADERCQWELRQLLFWCVEPSECRDAAA